MISYKIEGLDSMIADLQQSENWLETDKIDAIVQRAALPLVQKIKEGYMAGGHNKTGALVNSIEAFKRSRKSRDPYFTYYVGPRYSNSKSLLSMGGNAAHLLEFGTVERFRANSKKGGLGKSSKGVRTGLSSVYGAKHSTGRVKAYGVIRRAYDEYSPAGIAFLKESIVSLIIASSKGIGKKVA
jgi:hypothetical protein